MIRMSRILRILLWLAATLVVLAILPWLLPRPGIDGTIPDLPFSDSQFGSIKGIRMHWRQRLPENAADRPLVVLIHGFGGSGFSWRHTLDALERVGYPVIATDLPPFGYSERTGTGPDWPALVLAVADQVGAEQPLVLIGHSMGAGVAADLAARVPDRVRLLVMVDGTPGLRRDDSGWSWAFKLPPIGRAAEVFAAWRLVDPDTISDMLSSAFGRPPTTAELQGYYAPLTIPGTYPALLRQLARRQDPAEGWARVATTLVWGEHDRWVPIERAHRLLERHPEFLPLRVVDDAAHNPMDTQPESLNSLLIELISGQFPLPAARGSGNSDDRPEAHQAQHQ